MTSRLGHRIGFSASWLRGGVQTAELLVVIGDGHEPLPRLGGGSILTVT